MKYSKKCCKCPKGYKFQDEYIGSHDLVLCDTCYIGLLLESYLKNIPVSVSS